MQHTWVKFNGKHDGDVAESIRPTVPELCQNFVQKLVPDTKNGATPILWTDSCSATPKTPITAVSSKSNKFDKSTREMPLLYYWTFPKFSPKCSILRYIRRETRKRRCRDRTTHCPPVMLKLLAEIVHRDSKNGAIQSLWTDTFLATPKTGITAVSTKSNRFYKSTRKMILL